MPSIAALRHAPWSTSKIHCALRCPLEFRYKYVDKIPEPAVEPDARIGKAVHVALEGALAKTGVEEAIAAGRQDLLSDEERSRYDALADSVRKFAMRIDEFRARRRVASEMVEHKVAVNSDLRPTPFLAKDAFFRGVWDAGFVFDDGVLAVVDHKTGPRRTLTDFSDQLEGYATLAAANLPAIRRVWLGVHFVVEASMEWTAPVEIGAVKERFAPRVMAKIEEAAAALAGGFEPRTSGWCRRCAYRSICPAMRAVGGGAEAVGGGAEAVGGGAEAVGGGAEAVGAGAEAVGAGAEAVGAATEAVSAAAVGAPPAAATALRGSESE